MMEIKCYVCNAATDDWSSNLIGLKSQHSNVLIIDLIKNLLNGFKSMRNIHDKLNCICIDCLSKMEEYNRMCLRTKQCEKDLYNILIQTENVLLTKLSEIDSNTVSIDADREATSKLIDTQCIVEPEMISVNEIFDVKTAFNDPNFNDEQMEMHMSYEEINELCNPIDVDDVKSEFIEASEIGANVKRSVGRPRKSSDTNYACFECRIVFGKRDDLRVHNSRLHRRTPGRPKKIPAKEFKVKRSVGRPKKILETNAPIKKFRDVCIKQEPDVEMDNTVKYETNTVNEFPEERLVVEDDPNFEKGAESELSSEDIDQSDEDFVPSKRKLSKHKTRETSLKTESRAIKRKVGRPGLFAETKFECIDCDAVFETARSLNAHKGWHREQNFPKFKCKKCFYISDGQETFDAHAKLHDNVPPLQCVFCDYSAPTKTRLNLHTVKHITVKQFVCSICAMQFVRRNIFNAHMNYHLNIRKFACSECSMTFIEKKNLNRHMKTHTQIKPYSCKICSRAFAHSYNVRNHERTHTERDVYRKFKCNFCTSGYDSKSKLNRHLQKNHSVTPHSAIANNLDEIVSRTTGRWAQRDKTAENHPDSGLIDTNNDKNQISL